MDWFVNLFDAGASWLRSHLGHVALAMLAALLVIFGRELNTMIKGALQSFPKPIRLLGFTLACAFIYGGLLVLLTPLLGRGLAMLDPYVLLAVVVAFFALLGWVAERR